VIEPAVSKYDILGVLVDAVTPQQAVDRVLEAARARTSYSVTALAVHGVMTGVDDAEQRYRLNHFDLVTPDGQPVRWALNRLYGCALDERVYGPTLMRDLCAQAAHEQLPIALYGSTPDVLEKLATNLRNEFADLQIVGAWPSQFRTGTDDQADAVADLIAAAEPALVFVGLGCPRQEQFVYELGARIGVPTLAVGAAFEYHAGVTTEPPKWMQDAGLQWLHRLAADPKRLAHRYLVLSSRYVGLIARQAAGRPAAQSVAVAPARRINNL